jgi:5'-nucleotidase/UDP-sugar diphosphatase
MMKQIVILHTSDMHNKLTPAKAEHIREIKKQYPNSILLDSGDAIWAGNIFWKPGGENVLDLMNYAGYDAMCMGNREFHFLQTGIVSKTSKAKFPILSANLNASDSSKKLPTKPFKVFDINSIKIGVFGLTIPCITEKMQVKKVSHYYFDQPLQTAIAEVSELKKISDVVIALTHIGLEKDKKLIEKVDGIDLILGGHTHISNQENKIYHHNCFAKQIGILTIDFDCGIKDIRHEVVEI